MWAVQPAITFPIHFTSVFNWFLNINRVAATVITVGHSAWLCDWETWLDATLLFYGQHFSAIKSTLKRSGFRSITSKSIILYILLSLSLCFCLSLMPEWMSVCSIYFPSLFYDVNFCFLLPTCNQTRAEIKRKSNNRVKLNRSLCSVIMAFILAIITALRVQSPSCSYHTICPILVRFFRSCWAELAMVDLLRLLVRSVNRRHRLHRRRSFRNEFNVGHDVNNRGSDWWSIRCRFTVDHDSLCLSSVTLCLSLVCTTAISNGWCGASKWASKQLALS